MKLCSFSLSKKKKKNQNKTKQKKTLMYLIVSITKNSKTTVTFSEGQVKWFLSYRSKHGNIEFGTLLVLAPTSLHPTEPNWNVWVPWNNSDQTHSIWLAYALTFDKMHNIFENRVLGYPPIVDPCEIVKYSTFWKKKNVQIVLEVTTFTSHPSKFSSKVQPKAGNANI